MATTIKNYVLSDQIKIVFINLKRIGTYGQTKYLFN